MGSVVSSASGGQQTAAKGNKMLKLTAAELQAFDGTDPSKPLYISVRGKIYDVSASRSFYGPGGPYAVFGGKECARALAIMTTNAEDCNDNLEDATEKQLKTLADWESKFDAKYGVVGELVKA